MKRKKVDLKLKQLVTRMYRKGKDTNEIVMYAGVELSIVEKIIKAHQEYRGR